MGCETCGDKKPACDKGFTKAALEIKNPSQLVEFRKIVVPASLGDDTAVPPVVGKYCNAILYYEANDQVYLYSSDGIPTKITVDIEALKKQIKDLQDGLANEASTRSAADLEIWQEIEAIEASSDVVDVVGTYAELQQYDTSKLHDKDLIKVLQDETHDDAITYYRWSTSTHAFSYVGAEGPYYTVSETDVLLSGKQDTLIAGTNIQIAADGKTISATDTTYTHFTGATASTDGVQGLVPGPLAGDQDKVLKGDGTWGDAAANTIFYMNSSETGGTRHIFKDSAMTSMATSQEVFDANERGQVILRISTSVTPDQYSDAYLQNAYKATGDYQLLFLDEKTYRSFDTTTLSANTFTYSARVLQDQLTAGSNIQINGNTISATDTTYTAGTGIAITNNQIKALSVINVTFDSPSAGYAVLRAGTTVIDVMNAQSYIDRFGADVIMPMTGNNEYATIIGRLPADADGIHYLFEYGHLIYDFVVGLNDTKYTIIDTQAAMTGATAGAAGTKGLVPAPAMGQQNSFLRGDGTWQAITVPVLYTTQGQNEDGAVTQKLFTDTVGNIEAALQILNSGAGVP